MLNIKPPYQNKYGFTVIEFIIGFGLLSIVFTSIFSMFNYSLKAYVLGEKMDEALLHGRFGIEYIKEELREADMIISSDKILDLNLTYPENIGFVLFNDNGAENSDDKYSFITYYLSNNELVRIAINKPNSIYPNASKLVGYNVVCENILSIANTKVDNINKLIYLNFSTGYDEKEFHKFKSCIYLNKEFDY